MKKQMMTTAIALSLVSASVHAAEVESWQKGSIVTGGAIIGAVAGGPLGFLIGAGLGIWINDERDQAVQAEELSVAVNEKEAQMVELERELAQVNHYIADYDDLQMQLAQAEQSLSQYQHLAMQRLQFDIQFRTAQSQLGEFEQEKLQQLVSFIQRHPNIMISLEGYADPRGSSEYNYKLSNHRVQAVMNSLIEAGIDPERVQLAAFGASESDAAPGDYDGYAFERRVSISLFEQGLAMAE